MFSSKNLDPVVAEVDDVNVAVGRDGEAARTVKLTGVGSVKPELGDEDAGAVENLKSRRLYKHCICLKIRLGLS